VAFEPEAVLEGPEDRFDALADAREVELVVGFVFAARSEYRRAEGLGDRGLEVSAGVTLVADQLLAAGGCPTNCV